MGKIKILIIPPDKHGVGYFRHLLPFLHLQEKYPLDFHIDIKYNVLNLDTEFDGYQIVVSHGFFHNTEDFNTNIKRIEWLTKKGVLTITDIDDYWLPESSHPAYSYIKNKKIDVFKKEILKRSTYITTTTTHLRDSISRELKLKNVYVFPNAINQEERQFIPSPVQSDLTRIGWLGGSSHKLDLELMRTGISKIHDQFTNKVQFVLCGFDLSGYTEYFDKKTNKVLKRPILPKETVWYEYEKIFTHNYTVLDKSYIEFLETFKEIEYNDHNLPYVRKWTKPITTYATNYNYFDISLAPLVDSNFNRNKSQLKLIESGIFKKALIASEVHPYSDDLINCIDKNGVYIEKGNALLVSPRKNHKQWDGHMKRLINNPNLITDLGEKLHEMVMEKYILDVVNKNRSEFLKSIIK